MTTVQPTTHVRRGSFADFVLASFPLKRRLHPTTHDDVPATTLDRVLHSATMLGVALMISVVVFFVIVGVSHLEWTVFDDDGLPRLSAEAVRNGIYLPVMCGWWLYTVCNIAQWTASDDRRCGPRYALIPFGLGFVIIPIFYGLFVAAGESAHYYFADYLIGMLLYPATFMFLDETVRKWAGEYWGNHGESILLKKPVASSSSDHQAARTGAGSPAKSADSPADYLDVAPRLLPYGIRILAAFFSNGGPKLAIMFIYPLAFIPAFFSSGTEVRVILALLVHPILQLTYEESARGHTTRISKASKSQDEDHELKERYIECMIGSGRAQDRNTIEDHALIQFAGEMMVQSLHSIFFMTNLFAFYRRFMLLNVGTSSATLIVIVGASIEEALTRGFAVEIDAFIRKQRGLPPPKDFTKRLHGLMYMALTTQEALAELIAICCTSVAQILLQGSSTAFALGYTNNVKIDAMKLIVFTFLELFLEIIVDVTVMWAEGEHNIPVTRMFIHLQSLASIGLYLFCSIAGCSLALYSFIRFPLFSTCSDSDVCECLDDASFRVWFSDLCNSTNTTKPTTNNETKSLFDGVDGLSITVGVVTGIAILVIVFLSVMYSRYHKRNAVVRSLEKKNLYSNKKQQRLQQELEDANRQNRKLAQSLKEAQKVIDEVMSEGSLLDTLVKKIKHSDIHFIPDGYLGEGSFGTVKKARYKGKDVAVKTVRQSKMTKKTLLHFKDEIILMAPLHHPNLVNMLGACWKDGPDKLCLVLEFCANGSVHNLLDRRQKKHTWVSTYYNIALGIAKCFRYLHHEQPSGEPLIHRDLKPANVLVADDLSAKVADFGESRRYDQEKADAHPCVEEQTSFRATGALTMTLVGTPMYCTFVGAPEIVGRTPYDWRVDTYSFSITLLELAIGSPDFVRNQYQRGMAGMGCERILLGWRPRAPSKLKEGSPKLWDLITDCWEYYPSERPNFHDIVKRLEELDPNETKEEEVSFEPDQKDYDEMAAQATLTDENSRLKAEIKGLREGQTLYEDKMKEMIKLLEEGSSFEVLRGKIEELLRPP